MSEAVHHVALALAVLALGSSALRAVSPLAPAGLERAVAAGAAGAAFCVLTALGLGLLGLGASPVALTAAAVLAFLAVRRLLPPPAVGPAAELAAFWRERSGWERAALAALAGATGAVFVWLLRFPQIGFDSSLYHFPLIAGWIANGHPGSQLRLSYDIPYGAYPVTDEVAQTWFVGIARSWVPLSLWSPALFLLLAAASRVTLGNLGVRRGPAILATVALLATPLLVREIAEPQTDLPALTWLACTAALATGARRRPALLLPALLAAGLAIGTKPSAGPLTVLALAAGGFAARGRIGPLAPRLAAAALAAFALGGVWYTRNLVQHGSPFWPFTRGPWGDPQPRFFALIDRTFLHSARATLAGRLGQYHHRLGGGWIALAGLVPAVAGTALSGGRRREPARRATLTACAAALVGVLAWSTAWGSGLVSSPDIVWAQGFSLSALRFLLPAIGGAVLAVALATRLLGWAGSVAAIVLALSAAVSLVLDARLGAPSTPPALTLVLGALAGVAVLALASRAPWSRVPRSPRRYAPVLAAILAGLALAPASDGYLARYARSRSTSAYGHELVSWYLGRPGFEHGHDEILVASRGVLAQLAGDHFTHPLRLVPQHASCAEVLALARRRDLFVTELPFFGGLLGLVPYSAPACVAHRRPIFRDGPYAVYRF